LKRGGVREIFTGFARVLNGERFIPEEVVDFISLRPSQAFDSTQFGTKRAPIFTERQRSVADLLKQGLKNKEIARELNRSELYVRQIVTEIFRKVDVHTRAQFLVTLLKQGAVNQSDYA
jgi:two-component system nitrate/nitrite response regulator NarL